MADGSRRRIADTLRWRWQRHRLGIEAAALLAHARALGFPQPPAREPQPWAPRVAAAAALPAPPAEATPAAPEPAASGERREVAAATVCTLDHLHFALALATSMRRHHPELTLHILVVDGDGEELPGVPGCRFLRGSEVGLFADPYLALKLSAADLCCAAKPFLLAHLAATAGAARIVYLDADLYLFAPLTALLEQARRASFVVFPHTVAPMPRPELRWERPALGQLALAGVFNAGLFVFAVGEATQRFLATWRELVSEPGAFLSSRGAQTEQNSFNWVVAFLDDVHVMRDSAYNVAYWNLHERSLRWSATTPEGPVFTVDGHPLVVFHFSGYSPAEPLRLSLGNHRHPVHSDRALGRLLTFYAGELEAHDRDAWSAHAYRFAHFPSGVAIDRRLRELFREHEPELRSGIDPFTDEGEAFYCRALLSPLPGASSLLPLLLAAIYRERPDLRHFQADADLVPEPLLRWFSLSGVYEMNYGELFDRHRPVVPRSEWVRELAAVRAGLPQLFAACTQPLGRDRQRLLARLEEAERGDLVQKVRGLEAEIYAASPVFVVWRLVRERADLRQSYPDLLDEEAEPFTTWLRIFGTRLELLDREVPERFARAARGGALARIFSFLNRNASLARAWPLALAGHDHPAFARLLLGHLGGCPEYDLDDVVMYLWLMEERPWSGLPLVLELLANGWRTPSPLLAEGQEVLLAPLLASRPEFRRALDDYRMRFGQLSPEEAASLRAADGDRGPGPGRRPGINQFGFFHSPIGLGDMSRGLAGALRSQGIEVRENLLGNLAMAPDLRPEAFLRRYDYGLDTNLFVSFPHLEQRLFDLFPPSMVDGRRNVVYLAWEQREANPLWAPFFRDFDQVWALSAFAARGLAEALGREVRVIPCALDLARLPPDPQPAAAREQPFTLLFAFDANSSIERKNPEAVVAAFARAFAPGEPARLWLRIAHADRWPHRRRLERLAGLAAATGLDIRFFCQPMSKSEALALLAEADGYVSLHRAEGFGMNLAAAMAMGKPAIATGYSGNLEFMDAGNSLLVDFTEVEVRHAEGPFRGGSLWAEPSVAHAAERMRWVYEHRAAAAVLGERARATVRAQLSPASIGALAAAALRDPG